MKNKQSYETETGGGIASDKKVQSKKENKQIVILAVSVVVFLTGLLFLILSNAPA